MTKISRESRTGKFVVGRKAFAKVSSIEGIRPSKELLDDLKRLERVPAERRREMIAEKYGKVRK